MKRLFCFFLIIPVFWQITGQTVEGTSEYKEYNIFVDNKGPVIQVFSPKINSKTYADEINISGKVSDIDGIFQLIVDKQVISVDMDGNFSANVKLNKIGSNLIELKALDGKYVQSNLTWNIIKGVSNIRKGKDIAVIFATDLYEDSDTWKKLPNAINGGIEIASILEQTYGFIINKIDTNYTLIQMETTLRNLHSQVNEDDQVFIYISSHGEMDPITRIGYLACKNSVGGNRTSYMAHSYLENLLNNLPAKHVFVCIDACYSSTFDHELHYGIYSSSEDEIDKRMALKLFIESKLKVKSRLYLTSGLTETSAGRHGQFSPFTKELIKCLKSSDKDDGVLTFNEIITLFEKAKLIPEPHAGEFGDNHPGGSFLFIVQ